MDTAFEPVISRDDGLGELRFTATAALVSRETGTASLTAADIRIWLEANDRAAMKAAREWRLCHPAHAVLADGTSSWDGIVRLGPDDFPI